MDRRLERHPEREVARNKKEQEEDTKGVLRSEVGGGKRR